MPTRSLFKIEQYEKRLQEYAHQIPKFSNVTGKISEKEKVTIDFVYTDSGLKRIRMTVESRTGRIQKWGNNVWEETDYWGFTIEPKDYMDSPHATRISNEDEKSLEWLNKLMEGIEPEPRFQLRKLGRQTRISEPKL